MERSYLLHIPPSYDGRTPVPLVIVLHGGYDSTAYAGEPARDMETITGFTKKSDAEGFIVVYAEGYEMVWNVGFGVGPAFVSVNESVSLWARHDGCSEVPRIEEGGSTYLFNPYDMTISGSTYDMTEYIYSGGAKGTEVVLYKVIGGWHGWPTTATNEIWAFFESHPKNR